MVGTDIEKNKWPLIFTKWPLFRQNVGIIKGSLLCVEDEEPGDGGADNTADILHAPVPAFQAPAINQSINQSDDLTIYYPKEK